jgi:hypothetical protein
MMNGVYWRLGKSVRGWFCVVFNANRAQTIRLAKWGTRKLKELG